MVIRPPRIFVFRSVPCPATESLNPGSGVFKFSESRLECVQRFGPALCAPNECAIGHWNRFATSGCLFPHSLTNSIIRVAWQMCTAQVALPDIFVLAATFRLLR